MGTHPIFESDFDCLTEEKCNNGRCKARVENTFAAKRTDRKRNLRGCDKRPLVENSFTIRQSFYDYGAGYEDKAEFILAKATAIEFRDLLGWFIAQNEQLEQCSHEQRKRVFDDALLSRTVSAKDEEFSFQFKHNGLGSYLRIHEKNESKTKRKVYQKYITSRSISSQKYITVPSDGMEMFRDVLTELTDNVRQMSQNKAV